MSAQIPDFDSLMTITPRPPIVMMEGKGSWLRDQDGREYLDFIQGWAVNCLGHSPQVVVDAITRQASTLLNPSPAFFNAPMVRLADLIVQSSGLHKVYPACSGADANEGAIKLARKWGQLHRNGAHEIITMYNSFHGRTLATMSASGKPQWRELYEPKVPGFLKAPLNDLIVLRNLITEKTVAVMLEPIQGEGGVIPAEDDYLRELRALTREKGILLILDEVQTGIGRTGQLFAHQHAGISPDIMTLGKGLGGGVPLAALVAHRDVCCFAPGDQGGTYNGNPLMAAAGCAVMETVTAPGFLDAVNAAGDYLRAQLAGLARDYALGAVRGRGLLVALQLSKEIAPAIVETARDLGLLLNAPRANILRFMPALNVSRAEIDEMIRRLAASLDALGLPRTHAAESALALMA